MFKKLFTKIRAKKEGKQARAYNMAKQNRLTNDWIALARSFNYDISAGGAAMLGRGRELFQNDPYARKVVRSFKKGIVGPNGFILRNKAGEWQNTDAGFRFVYDKPANAMINDAWARWGKDKHCTLEGDETFRHYCGTLAQSVFIDGEVFIKKLSGKKYNKFGFTTQPITSEYCDWRLNKKLDNGNSIVMGVEVTPYWQKVAYWFRKSDPYNESQYGYNWTSNYTRVPAEDIIHLYIKETVHQLRGVTMFAPVGIRLKMLYGFEEAALVRTRATANVPWIVQRQKDALAPPNPNSDSEDSDGNKITELEQGQIYMPADGYEVKSMESEYPHPVHQAFTDVNLHGVAAGTDMAYATISANYSGMNFTVSRTAKNDEEDGYEDLQSWFAETLLDPVNTTWLQMAILSGQVKLPPQKLEKFNKPKWVGRTWKSVQPEVQIDADIKELRSGLSTLEDKLAKRGKDLEEHFEQLVLEAQMKKDFEEKHGVQFDWDLSAAEKKTTQDEKDTKETNAGNNGNGKHLIHNNGN